VMISIKGREQGMAMNLPPNGSVGLARSRGVRRNQMIAPDP
jgi:hypothetical protein